MLTTARLPLLVVAGLLCHCSGQVLEVGDDDPPPVAAPKTIADRCPPRAQTTDIFESEDAMQQALQGRWFRCRGVDSGVLFTPGIEFVREGIGSTWYALVDDGAGGLVRATDDARRGLYAVGPPVTLNFRFTSGAEQTLVVLLDGDTKRMSVVRSTFQSVDVAYVHE